MKRLVAVLATIALWSGTVLASSITFSGASGNLSASATFETCGGGTSLCITFSNTSTNDVLVPADVLTGVFFNIQGNPTLTPISAVLAGSSFVLFGTTDPGGVVSGEFAFEQGLSSPSSYGIASSGYISGTALFPGGTNLQGPVSVDGLQYGITSAGDNPLTGNAPVTGDNALIGNSVLFTLAGWSSGFDPSTSISGVVFQYGTSFGEPSFPGTPNTPVPEPSTISMLALGFGGLLLGARRHHTKYQ